MDEELYALYCEDPDGRASGASFDEWFESGFEAEDEGEYASPEACALCGDPWAAGEIDGQSVCRPCLEDAMVDDSVGGW